MTIRVNDAALTEFLRSRNGPVGLDLERRARNVEEKARENASGDIIGIQTGDLLAGLKVTIREGPDGLEAVVGTDAQHRGFNYPGFHNQNGRPWLTDALREATR